MKRILVSFLVMTACVAHASAQTPRRSLRAGKAEAVKLDGRLDEPAWKTAEAGTDFTQRYPDPGKPATLRTEVRVLYDANAVYVGARMFDPHPDSIAAPLGRRDPGDVTSDWIDVIFDSYNDRRTAYRFGVNPAGTKLDVYHFNDSDDDNSWDALWDVATRIDSLGWTAEYRIPLSQLRYHAVEGERIWGLQFYRAVARRDEWSFWSPYTPSMPGFVSAMGILHGIDGIQPSRAIEVTPYLSSQVVTQPISSSDPLNDRSALKGAAGVDFRLALGPALSLTGAVNPDFGQVELDPAVINLSAVETFVAEKRPFFLEGSGIFDFGSLPVDDALSCSRFIHWRRIGRAPQLSANGQWTSSPAQTTILGAAKLSGQINGGWSLGVTEVATQREEARIVDDNGARSSQVVEPLSNYFVARAKHDFRDGRTTFGLMTTAVNRSLDEFTSKFLRSSAQLLGIDGSTATADRRVTFGGFFMQSIVNGAHDAIAATQRSTAHYLQRPDSRTLEYDPARTRLLGHDAAAGIVFRGNPWNASAQVREITPGYEANDLGFEVRGDVRSATASIGAQHNSSSSVIRSGYASLFTQHAWNFDGDGIYHRLGARTSAQLNSFWNASFQIAGKPSLIADRHTRGGPLFRVPAMWETSGSVASDARRKMMGRVSATREDRGENGVVGSISAFARLRPTSAFEVSLAPTFESVRDGAQYIQTVADPLASRTYNNRYVFATLRQRTLSMDARADWTLTPALSFQLFAQPFVSSARFDNYKELRTPSAYDFSIYGKDAGTVTRSVDGRVSIDPDGNGAASAFQVRPGSNQTGFVTRALRMNAVLRWEYRGGSTLYVVWQQTRDDQDNLNNGEFDTRIVRVLDVPSRNVLLVKATYRIGN